MIRLGYDIFFEFHYMYERYIPRKCIDITTISTTICTLLITEDVMGGGGGFVTCLSDTVTLKTVCSLAVDMDMDTTTTTTDIDTTDIIKQKICTFVSIAD
jgi:hypothetical protein